MEFMARKSRTRTRQSWSSVAFIVESILLLVFLVASLAVLTRVFTASLNRSIESRTLDAATIAATSIAEHFTADPTGVSESTTLGDLVIKCEVTEDPRENGTMYHAHIDVYDTAGKTGGTPVYSIETARYESQPGGTANSESSAAGTGSGSGSDASRSDAEGEVS